MVKAVTRTLTSPAKTGTLITIPDLRRIASRLDLPITIRNDRAWILEELMRIAIDYGKLPELVEELKTLIRVRAERLEELALEYPASRKLVEEHIESSRRALALLEDLKEVYYRFSSSGGEERRGSPEGRGAG
jgi:hypothetical protein